MKFKDFIEVNSIIERGKRITNLDIYNNYGPIKVISSKIDGSFGYISKQFLELNENSNANQLIGKNTFVYAIEGNAGYISLYSPQRIWLSDVSGLFDVKVEYINRYGKELIAIFLQDFFVKNRHNNSTQPKFLLKNILNKEINLDYLEKLMKYDLSEIRFEETIKDNVKKYYSQINHIEEEMILFEDFIEGYIERGPRLVKGRDLYINHGPIKVISSTTTGPMGYYNKGNYLLKDNDFVYAIDGANAGYVSIYPPQHIFLTDHAGVISVKEEYVNQYGKVAIALFLQDYFVKLRSRGTQPTFLLKNNVNLKLNIKKLDVISKMELDRYIKACEE